MTRKRKSKEENKEEETTENQELDLTRKFRPTTLDDFKGNTNLKKSLKTMIDKGTVPHSILFYGDYGSGKTTLARILTNYLECSELDVKEINTADFRGIDTVRNLLRSMHTKPMKGKYKAYIIDEAAQLGRGGDSSKNEAQNALLKALEEPPSHCYFFLCTTDPQNLISTIKSRCTQFQVNTLSQKQMITLLNEVAEKEEINLPKKVALQITKDSLGHPRDALKLLQKIMYLDEDEMLESAKREAEKQEEAITLCRELMNGSSWKRIAEILKALEQDPETVRRIVRGYFTSVLLNGNESAFIVLDALKEPFFNIDAKNELVRAIFEAWSELNG